MITDKMIQYVAALAKLEIGEQEAEQAKKDLDEIIEYVGIMNELDTDDVEPMPHVFAYDNVMRDDVVTNTARTDDILANAPDRKDSCFKVPKTVE